MSIHTGQNFSAISDNSNDDNDDQCPVIEMEAKTMVEEEKIPN